MEILKNLISFTHLQKQWTSARRSLETTLLKNSHNKLMFEIEITLSLKFPNDHMQTRFKIQEKVILLQLGHNICEGIDLTIRSQKQIWCKWNRNSNTNNHKQITLQLTIKSRMHRHSTLLLTQSKMILLKILGSTSPLKLIINQSKRQIQEAHVQTRFILIWTNLHQDHSLIRLEELKSSSLMILLRG